MSKLQPVRGTKDLLPDEKRVHTYIVDLARSTCELYGYSEISTPIFEFSEVFERTLGDNSDIVTKEMYSFHDKSGDIITLRPENTAGVARALISNGLQQALPLKYFYSGPMFRYERPQKGRLRQFHQIGVELLGVPEELGDVEIIALGASLLKALALTNVVKLEINSLGDKESRQKYRNRLVEYLEKYSSSLSPESKARLERNPLRILDSKNKGDREIIGGAPTIAESLTTASHQIFDSVCAGLDMLDINYSLNPYLVRGLDYYCHTAFEFTTAKLGAQTAVLAGGRYDGLIETMGGPPTNGVGWAAGIERIAMLLGNIETDKNIISVVPIGEVSALESMVLAEQLRDAGLCIDIGFRGNLTKRLKRANRIGAVYAVLIGEEELKNHMVTVRDLQSGHQLEVAREELCGHLCEQMHLNALGTIP